MACFNRHLERFCITHHLVKVVGERKIGGRLLENRAVGDDDDALIL
ncbi:MAG: hypothetical protein BWY50_02003 [Spirochaetes bacterium ADurb.Bin315]|nr:MAG: hypothetical protein BWY50_02003 [Spirochaetes bacterium ADurb.Bin315]